MYKIILTIILIVTSYLVPTLSMEGQESEELQDLSEQESTKKDKQEPKPQTIINVPILDKNAASGHQNQKLNYVIYIDPKKNLNDLEARITAIRTLRKSLLRDLSIDREIFDFSTIDQITIKKYINLLNKV